MLSVFWFHSHILKSIFIQNLMLIKRGGTSIIMFIKIFLYLIIFFFFFFF